MSIKHIGSRLKSDDPIIMFRRFPQSDRTNTIPPGQPTPVIDSFLANGYYQLKRPDENVNWYVKKTDDLQVVPEDAEDESGIFDTVSYWFTDAFNVIQNRNAKATEHLTAGAKKSVEDLKDSFLTIGGGIRGTIFAILGVVVVVFLIMLISKFD